jgi:hypothetical protein
LPEKHEKNIQEKRKPVCCVQPAEKSSGLPACKTTVTARQHIISDFIIGAHAFVFAELLLSRGRGFYKTYFKDLKIAQ